MGNKKTISVTIPVYNEKENLLYLYDKLVTALNKLEKKWECIFVNDGSDDGSHEILDSIVAKDKRIRVIHFRRNFGQTAAMQAGFDYAEGEIIVPMDGDLQNDPEDIGKMIDKLNEGYDVVSGWRKNRKDKAFRKVFVSKVANRVISILSGVRLNDYGCSMKAYRKDVIKGVRIYGEMHRFIPVYAKWQGAVVGEIPVRHHARFHGKSNYGLERFFKVLFDMIVVKFLQKYSQKPMYIFGGFGFFCLFAGFCSGAYAVILKLAGIKSFVSTPLPLLTVLLCLLGVISILMGLLAELVMRTYYESQDKRTYMIKSINNQNNI
jgi:glycosyltransferase involved in cell wall biosynthesis